MSADCGCVIVLPTQDALRSWAGECPAVHRLRRVKRRRTAAGGVSRCTPAAAGEVTAYCRRRGYGPAVHRPYRASGVTWVTLYTGLTAPVG